MVAAVRRRVLLLITDLEIGGTPTVVRELSLRLPRADVAEIQVACLGAWGPVADQIVEAGGRVTALGARGVLDFATTRARLVRLIREERIDTILSFLVHANAMIAGAKLLLPKVRSFQSIQTTQPLPRWHWGLQAVAQHAADRIVVPSESAAAAAREWARVPAKKIVIIPNAVDVTEFQLPPAKPESSSAFPIGFLGRLDPVKRVDDLIEAVGELGELVHLHIFGDGSEGPRIVRKIAQLQLSNRITLHGPVARPQEALGRVGILVLPSDAEGFGLVLIEAMAAGVAVIATDVSGIRDVVRDGQTGLLVPARSPRALAQAIQRMVKDEALRARLVEAGRKDVERRFAWTEVIELYRQLLE